MNSRASNFLRCARSLPAPTLTFTLNWRALPLSFTHTHTHSLINAQLFDSYERELIYFRLGSSFALFFRFALRATFATLTQSHNIKHRTRLKQKHKNNNESDNSNDNNNEIRLLAKCLLQHRPTMTQGFFFVELRSPTLTLSFTLSLSCAAAARCALLFGHSLKLSALCSLLISLTFVALSRANGKNSHCCRSLALSSDADCDCGCCALSSSDASLAPCAEIIRRFVTLALCRRRRAAAAAAAAYFWAAFLK